MVLKLGLVMGIGTNTYSIDIDYVKEAENLGFDSIWTSEAWGSDAVTPAAWILAQTTKIKVGTGIIQMPARTPSCVAMTAMTLNTLSGGRFILGLGPSGPQVVEGWYGVPYGRPITRLREYVQIIRKILERKEPLTHDGYHYQIPMNGEKATGLGKPLKSILHGDPSLKIFSAAISPAGVKAAAELTDGFIPFFMDPNGFRVFEADINEGLQKAGKGKTLAEFEIAPFCEVSMDEDLKKRLSNRNASTVIGPRSASSTINLGVDRPLGPNLPNLDVKTTRVETLRPDMPILVEGGGSVKGWSEALESSDTPFRIMANGDLAAVSAGSITYLGGWFDDEALTKVFNEICLKAEIKVIQMPEGLRRRATSKETFWFNYGTKNVEVEGRSFPPQSVTRDVI